MSDEVVFLELVDALLDAPKPTTRPKPRGRLTAELLGVAGIDHVVEELDERVWLPHTAPAKALERLDEPH